MKTKFWEGTLYSAASIAVVKSLWYHQDIDHLETFVPESDHMDPLILLGYRREIWDKLWREFEEKVINNIPTLPIPLDFQNYLLEMVQEVGRSIADFKSILKHFDLPTFDFRKSVIWDCFGYIDQQATGSWILDNASLDVKDAFRLACALGISSTVRKVWTDVEEHYSNPDIWDGGPKDEVLPGVTFWALLLTDRYKERSNINQDILLEYAFIKSVERGHAGSAKCFFDEIRDDKKITAIRRLMESKLIPKIDGTIVYVLRFLYDAENFDDLPSIAYEWILTWFTKWPLQSNFMDVVCIICQHFSDNLNSWNKIADSFTWMCFMRKLSKIQQNLFSEFWKYCSSETKQYVYSVRGSLYLDPISFSTDKRDVFSLLLKKDCGIDMFRDIFSLNSQIALEYFASIHCLLLGFPGNSFKEFLA